MTLASRVNALGAVLIGVALLVGGQARADVRPVRIQMSAAWIPHVNPILSAASGGAWQAVSDHDAVDADFALREMPARLITAAEGASCAFPLAIPAAVVAIESDLLEVRGLESMGSVPDKLFISRELRDLTRLTLPASADAAHDEVLRMVLADPAAVGLVRWQTGGRWPPGLRPLRIGGAFPGEAGAAGLAWGAVLVPLRLVPNADLDRLCAVLHAWASPPIQIAAVGDIMLGRSINTHVQRTGEVNFPFEQMQPLLDTADLRVGNLESVISELGEAQYKAYAFRVGYWGIEALRNARFEVLSLGNNHALDFGPAALVDTLVRLQAAGIGVVGAGRSDDEARAPLIREVGGLRLAFLGYVNTARERYGFDPLTTRATPNLPGVAWGDPDAVAADVRAARESADVVIVLLHSGTEWRIEPTRTQQAIARAAIEAGATAVIGAHPHVMQGAEYYQGGFIAYSLGNFVFEAYDNGQAFLRLWIGAEGVRAYAWEPYRVALSGRPIPATATEAHLILAGMNSMTKTLNPAAPPR